MSVIVSNERSEVKPNNKPVQSEEAAKKPVKSRKNGK